MRALSRLCPSDDRTDVFVARKPSTSDVRMSLIRSLILESVEPDVVVLVPRNASLLTRFLYDMEH